jgi:hypothetical protein
LFAVDLNQEKEKEMAFSWEFEGNDFIVIRATGQVAYQDYIDFLDEIRKEVSHIPKIYELILCDEDLVVEVSSDDTQRIANKVKENLSFRQNSVLMFVCPTDHIFGLCRQLGMRVESNSMRCEVFRTEDDARRWLKQNMTLSVA